MSIVWPETAASPVGESPVSDALVIEGGVPLRGSVRIGGAKNAALPIMAATLLTDEECVISNIPDIEDIRTMTRVLDALGADVRWQDRHTIAIRARHIGSASPPEELVRRMRASFLVTGPLIARVGRARAPHPGGCQIGVRPVNVDVRGFEAMGARVLRQDGAYSMTAPRLHGAEIFLDYPSHTGTENLLMAACLARGTTIIQHASVEPEVEDLARFLVKMGARIEGIGTNELRVEGVERLHGTRHHVMPDRLAAGTFAIAAAITGGAVVCENVIPKHLRAVLYKLRDAGAEVRHGADWIEVRAAPYYRAVEVQTLHYPGFPTDLQAAFGAFLTQAVGTSIIHERVFENRLLYLSELRKLGAVVEGSGQTAHISGPCRLRGAEVRALDIRSGAAVILAALAAEGVSIVRDVRHVRRGYENIDAALASLGARIRPL